MSIEHSRKHGPFDVRYPLTPRKPRPPSPRSAGEERTDWEGFLARFYPGRGRHDLDAFAAYESYWNDVEGRRAGDSAAPGRHLRRRGGERRVAHRV